MATEPVILLKFMPFCRRVPHLIRTLASLGRSPHSHRGKGGPPELFEPRQPALRRKRGRRGTAPSLPATPRGFRCCRVSSRRQLGQHGGRSEPLAGRARPRCRRSLRVRDPRGGRPGIHRPRARPRFRLGAGGAGAAGGGEVPAPPRALGLSRAFRPRRCRPRPLGAGRPAAVPAAALVSHPSPRRGGRRSGPLGRRVPAPEASCIPRVERGLAQGPSS